MSSVPAPDHPAEAERLQTLHSLALLDTHATDAWDGLAKLASDVCETPIGLVSLVDADRQWFKARIGLDAAETPRDQAFCAHAILDDHIMKVQDATQDARFQDNPLVTGEPNIRFYAGVPIKAPNGQPLGTVCVIDREPRILTAQQEQALQQIGAQAEELLRMRNLAKQLQEHGAQPELIEQLESEVLRPLTPLFLPLSTLRSMGDDAQRDDIIDDVQSSLQQIRDEMRRIRTEAAK